MELLDIYKLSTFLWASFTLQRVFALQEPSDDVF